MSAQLTVAQRAFLRAELERRRSELAKRLSEHLAGQTRAEHMVEMREQDADDVPQREGERGLDMALSELETRELGLVGEALRRIELDRYGQCADCDEDIPFERLRAEPWALRCVGCQSQREAA